MLIIHSFCLASLPVFIKCCFGGGNRNSSLLFASLAFSLQLVCFPLCNVQFVQYLSVYLLWTNRGNIFSFTQTKQERKCKMTSAHENCGPNSVWPKFRFEVSLNFAFYRSSKLTWKGLYLSSQSTSTSLGNFLLEQKHSEMIIYKTSLCHTRSTKSFLAS